MEIQMIGASWCQPCKNAKAYLTEKEVLGTKVHYHELGSNKELEQKYGVRGLPTFVLVDAEGKELDKFVGFHKDKIDSFLNFVK